jgi:hypothetical protein
MRAVVLNGIQVFKDLVLWVCSATVIKIFKGKDEKMVPGQAIRCKTDQMR